MSSGVLVRARVCACVGGCVRASVRVFVRADGYVRRRNRPPPSGIPVPRAGLSSRARARVGLLLWPGARLLECMQALQSNAHARGGGGGHADAGDTQNRSERRGRGPPETGGVVPPLAGSSQGVDRRPAARGNLTHPATPLSLPPWHPRIARRLGYSAIDRWPSCSKQGGASEPVGGLWLQCKAHALGTSRERGGRGKGETRD